MKSKQVKSKQVKRIITMLLVLVMTLTSNYVPMFNTTASAEGLTVGTPQFTFNGSAITKMVEGSGDITATVSFTRSGSDTQKATMLAALYDNSTNKLVNCKSADVNIISSAQSGNVTIPAPDDKTKYNLILYIWDNVSTMKPLRVKTVLSADQTAAPIYNNESYSIKDRAADMVVRMARQEKAGQMNNNNTPAIPRLGIKSYYYQQEGLHGWSSGNTSYTVFPMPIAMGATWNPDLVQQIASAIGDEARGNANIGKTYLNVYAPTINLARDPRWGRTEETYSEDPYQLSRFAVAFIKGMQGENPKYLKVSTSVKHFAANNYEDHRTDGSSNVDGRSMYEYFLPAFKAAVMEAKSHSIMSAYNAINGVPCNVNSWLQQSLLRGEWGFDGFVTSDSGDIPHTITKHAYPLTTTLEQASALSVRSGMDQDCGANEFKDYLPTAYDQKLVTEADLDIAAKRIMETRIKYGEFDTDKSKCEYNSIPATVINSQQNKDLARQAEKEGIVLLKNSENLLPLSKDLTSVSVIGPYAESDYFLGGYTCQNPFYKTSIKQGIQNKIPNITINYAQGANQDGTSTDDMITSAVDTAKKSGTVILALGTNNKFGSEGNDADNLDLPGRELELAQKVIAANPNTVVVLCSGNPMSVNWLAENAKAMVESWHGGQEYGNALADVLFGDYNPSGKLTQTYYKDSSLLPALDDYTIMGKRLYMYSDPSNVLYPYGYGLSYTTFAYSNLKVSTDSIKSYEDMQVSVDVTNTGARAGDEVVQLYLKSNHSTAMPMPQKALKGFKKITLNPNETKTVTFTINGMDGAYYNVDKKRFEVDSGAFQIMVGTSSQDIKQTGNVNIDWMEPAYNGFYKLVNKNSGLAIEADDQVDDWNGANVRQGNYYGYNNQKWTVEQVGESDYRIVNVESNCALDVKDESTADGARLQLMNYSGTENQKFTLSNAENGYKYITGKQSGKVIEVAGQFTNDGANVDQYANNGGDNQKWMLVPANDDTHVEMPNGWNSERKVNIASATNNQFITSKNNNYTLTPSNSTYGAFETFYIYDLGNNNAAIRAFSSGKYFSVDTATGIVSATAGSVGIAETFEVANLGNGKITLKSKLNNKYITVQNNGAGKLVAGSDAAGVRETFVMIDSGIAPTLNLPNWTVSSSKADNVKNAIDRDPSTRWSTGAVQAPGQWFKVDLINPSTVKSITLDSTAAPGDYPRGYKIEVSSDDVTYTTVKDTTPVASTDVVNGVLTIPISPAVTARYIKITQTGTSGGYWSIYELYVDATPVATSPVITVEAENANLGNGAVAGNDTNASGGKYVGGLDNTNAYCEAKDIYGGTGYAFMKLKYAASQDAKLGLYINGQYINDINLPASTGTSDFSKEMRTNIVLSTTYPNTIKLVGGNGDVKLDTITITSRTYVKYECESGSIGPKVTIADDKNASGLKCLHDFGDSSAYCQINSVEGDEGGTTYLDICYAGLNDSKIAIRMNGTLISGNGITDGVVNLPKTTGWSDFSGHVRVEVPVIAGANNVVRLESKGSVNLDYITILR